MPTQNKSKHSKVGRNEEKCAIWRRTHHGGEGNKFTMSKEHRHCGPIGRYTAAKHVHLSMPLHQIKLEEVQESNYEKIVVRH